MNPWLQALLRELYPAPRRGLCLLTMMLRPAATRNFMLRPITPEEMAYGYTLIHVGPDPMPAPLYQQASA